MMEVVVAVYESAQAAETALDDLELARIPSTQVRQFGNHPDADLFIIEIRRPGAAPDGDRILAVTVEDRHAQAVKDILEVQAPSNLTEAPLHIT